MPTVYSQTRYGVPGTASSRDHPVSSRDHPVSPRDIVSSREKLEQQLLDNRLSISAIDISRDSGESSSRKQNDRPRSRKLGDRSTFARISRRFGSKKELGSSHQNRDGPLTRDPISFSRPDISSIYYSATPRQYMDQSYAQPLALGRKKSTGYSRTSLISIGDFQVIKDPYVKIILFFIILTIMVFRRGAAIIRTIKRMPFRIILWNESDGILWINGRIYCSYG